MPGDDSKVSNGVIMEDSTGIILKALRFAAEKHNDQRRRDSKSSPYINHTIKVAET